MESQLNAQHIRYRLSPQPQALTLWLALVLFSGVVSACCKTTPKPSIPTVEPPSAGVKPTRIALLADTHFTNVAGYRVLKSMSCASDETGSSAIRAPVVDLWAPEVLRHVLEKSAEGLKASNDEQLLIHLGDAASIGCVNEFSSFVKEMQTHWPGKWFMAPGNHDAFLQGNWNHPQWPDRKPNAPSVGTCSPDRSDCPASWAGACVDESSATATDGPHHLYKKRLIDLYVGAIGQGALVAKDGWNCNEGAKDTLEHICRFDKVDAQHADMPEVGTHFLLQQVRLSAGVVGILIDTSNLAPGLINSAGRFAGFSDEQLDKIEEWLDKLAQEKPARRAFIFGHLPMSAFRYGDTFRANSLLAHRQVLAYASAHNHQSASFCHPGHQNFPGLELNIGSVLDWPMEYGFLNFFPQQDFYAVAYEKRQIKDDIGNTCPVRPPGNYGNYCDGIATGWTAHVFRDEDDRLKDEDEQYHRRVGEELRTWMQSDKTQQKDESGLMYARRMLRERTVFDAKHNDPAQAAALRHAALCNAMWASQDERTKRVATDVVTSMTSDPDRCPGAGAQLSVERTTGGALDYVKAPPQSPE